ncbi:DUF1648 domain-containing protein [Bacillus sp. DX1.1]|uniref:DUF1648 domain-containing protein n=1 Tax=unclassified Bacillus (in: firmicutes) TaxID=185979 RepID=UPI002570CF22|nr:MULTISPECIES: DUF1648 domain-containing protein [unclassified Bacillus (in: firmicutes)]MDM5155540.1 DUF1648 domain-containing protein [Bacillus sp. DX1.1]WJE79849.1 DUF1648 domain-containing protein [Bacillus sp. DX3.1]
MNLGLSIPKTKFEKALDILSVILLCGTFLYVFYMWGDLPEKIPSHFDGSGTPDAWNGKESIWILPIIGLIIFFLLYMLCKAPHLFNYPYNVPEEKLPQLYLKGRKMLTTLNFEIIFFFALGTWLEIQTIFGWTEGLGVWFLPSFIIILLGTIVMYIIQFRRI